MGMLGNQLAPGTQFAVTNDSYNGDGSTTAFTLSQSVSATTDIEVIVDNVQQSPHDGSYSVSGTALTFSGAPSTGTNNIYVIYHGSKHHTTAQVIPDAGSVDHSKMHTNATLPITRDMTNNRVGINHTSPEQHLHISSSTNTRALIETTNAGSVAELQLKNTAQTVKLGIETSSNAGGGAYGTGTLASNFAIVNNGNTGFHMDGNGYIRTPRMPHAVAQYLGGGNQTFSGATVTFNTVHENVGNVYNSSNGRFTAPVAGRYLICVNVLSGSANGHGLMNIRKNGGYFLPGTNGWVQIWNYSNNNDSFATYSSVETLAINDYLDLYIHASHDHFHWNNYNRMSVTMIG